MRVVFAEDNFLVRQRTAALRSEAAGVEVVRGRRAGIPPQGTRVVAVLRFLKAGG